MKYSYAYKTPDGTRHEASIEAASRDAVFAALRERGIRHLKVVFSPEQPAETTQSEAPPPGRRSVPASVAWVPSCAGLMMAGTVVQDLIEERSAQV